MRIFKFLSVVIFVFLAFSSCFSQQEFVSRYDAFGSYSFLSTSKLNLFQRGFNGQFGVNVRRWVALGADFSVFTGHSSLFPNQLDPAQQAKLAPYAPLLPPGYVLAVKYNSNTYTFTAGPQFNYRHFRAVTLFVRPSLGGLHVTATAKPEDPIQSAVVAALLGSSGKKSDTVVFYGFGGGLDLNFSKHVAWRMGTDFVHMNMFSGLLNGGENTVRFSAGPTFRFGRNVE